MGDRLIRGLALAIGATDVTCRMAPSLREDGSSQSRGDTL